MLDRSEKVATVNELKYLSFGITQERSGTLSGREKVTHWSCAISEVLKSYFAFNLILLIWIMTVMTWDCIGANVQQRGKKKNT